MDGLIYLHNLAGQTLAQANAEIERLHRIIKELEEQISNSKE